MAGTHLLSVSDSAVDATTRTDGLAGGGAPYALRWSHTYSDGLNEGEVGHVYAAEVTLAASAASTLDLYGSLLSTVGETINGSKLRFIKVVNDGPGNVNITTPAANGVPLFIAASDGITLEDGDMFQYASLKGKTITNTTAQDLTFTESSTTAGVTFRILMGLRGI